MDKTNQYRNRELHFRLIEALKAFDKKCTENDINYSLHGGTLLGAVRNAEMIPWDDDVDVSMTREDYKKLCVVMKNASDSVIEFNEKLKYHAAWLPQFYHLVTGERIDIFIWDYISECKAGAHAKIFLLKLLQGMMKKTLNLKGFNLYQRIQLSVTYIIGRFIPMSKKMNWYQVISENCLIGKKLYIHKSNDSVKGLSEVFDEGLMKDYTRLSLEDSRFQVNKRYEESLIRSYGKNYIEPPPIEERVATHRAL